MNAAREEIFRRVRGTQGRAPAPVERAYRTSGTLGVAARHALLCERLVDYGARVERDLAVVLAELAAARIGIPPGLPAEWRPASPVADDDLSAQELDALDGVVTGCTVAIAETGTIVLAGGPTEGRRALTLVPDLHVCIVRADQVVETVPEAFASLRGLERRPLTFVSGPSATSDIELKRVEGVHGPRRLVVVMIEA
ncbi:MAG: lactate utilization protein C [Gaiellaceae bacterium]